VQGAVTRNAAKAGSGPYNCAVPTFAEGANAIGIIAVPFSLPAYPAAI